MASIMPFGRSGGESGPFGDTASPPRAPGSGAWHVYVLELTGERYFVGGAPDVREAFAEHMSGAGGRVTARWRPVGFGPLCVSSPIPAPRGADEEALRADCEELQRCVTAQLVVLLGVNRVRGGSVKDVHTGDGSIVIDYDLVHARDYTRTNADLDLVASKVATPLGLDFINTRKHIDAMLREHAAGQQIFGTPRIHIDSGWNVVVNGAQVAPNALHTVPYDPVRAVPLARLAAYEWNVLFKGGTPSVAGGGADADMDLEANSMDDDYPDVDSGHDPQDVFVITFGVLALSVCTLAICVFSAALERYFSSSPHPSFPIVCLALIIPTGVTMQMRQRAGPFNLAFVVTFTIASSLMGAYVAYQVSKYTPFMLFMWTMGLVCATGVMAVTAFVWSKATGGRHGLILCTVLGAATDIATLIAMYMTWSGRAAGATFASTAIKVGFGIGYVLITGVCLAVLLRLAWTIDVRERFYTKRALYAIPAAALPALACYGIGYVLFATLQAVKFV